jgi:hypothetical protein
MGWTRGRRAFSAHAIRRRSEETEMGAVEKPSRAPVPGFRLGPVGAPPMAGRPEPWLDKHGIADHLACSVRWIESRMGEGMPHTVIAGRAKFRISEVEAWLELHGHIEHCGDRVLA